MLHLENGWAIDHILGKTFLKTLPLTAGSPFEQAKTTYELGHRNANFRGLTQVSLVIVSNKRCPAKRLVDKGR